MICCWSDLPFLFCFVYSLGTKSCVGIGEFVDNCSMSCVLSVLICSFEKCSLWFQSIFISWIVCVIIVCILHSPNCIRLYIVIYICIWILNITRSANLSNGYFKIFDDFVVSYFYSQFIWMRWFFCICLILYFLTVTCTVDKQIMNCKRFSYSWIVCVCMCIADIWL